MGASIYSFAEILEDGKWERVDFLLGDEVGPFANRSYGIFGFLADVKNYSRSPVIALPRGFPDDSEYLHGNKEYIDLMAHNHSHSYLLLEELLSYDYDQEFEDLRIGKYLTSTLYDGSYTGKPGEGQIVTLRDFLGHYFFTTLEALQKLGEPDKVRIIFSFDS